jgi:hypothetical protein
MPWMMMRRRSIVEPITDDMPNAFRMVAEGASLMDAC